MVGYAGTICMYALIAICAAPHVQLYATMALKLPALNESHSNNAQEIHNNGRHQDNDGTLLTKRY